jgi:hypothetical protein
VAGATLTENLTGKKEIHENKRGEVLEIIAQLVEVEKCHGR